MLFRRRASLLSASHVPRRVCHQTPTNTPPSVDRPIHRSERHASYTPHTSHTEKCRAMHTTPLRSTSTTSPALTCRWKQGRPVNRSDNFPRRFCQPTGKEAVPMAGDHRRIRQVSATLPVQPAETAPTLSAGRFQRVGLWNPSHGLRFANTATAEAPKSDFLPDAAETTSSPADEQAATTRTDDPSPRTQNEASDDTGQNGEAVSSQSQTESKGDEEDDTDKYVSLAYQIPEDKLRAAMLATPNTRDRYWSARLYRGPDGELLSTHYCKSFDVAERVAKYFLQEKVVGFDIEWKPRGNPYAIKQNASLIQLACEDRIALFHVSLFPGTKVEQLMPPSLKAVLESPDIYKVGVAVKGDFKRLEKYLNIQAQGVFELSRLHNLVEWYETEPSKVSNRLVKLSSQVLQHLQLPLYKGEQLIDDPEITSSVRESDWSLLLNPQQIHYAAADAYAGFRLYHMLEWKRTRMRPTPPPVALCDFDNKPTPRSKESYKRVKKAKDVADTAVKSLVDVSEEQQEDEGDAEGYETATEELSDSHQLEEPPHTTPTTASADGANKISVAQSTVNNDLERAEDMGAGSGFPLQKRVGRVGRVGLSWLNNSDPGYPKLPKSLQEEDAESEPTASSKHEASVHLENQDNTISQQRQNNTDDEYADWELEDALGRMALDNSGMLTKDVNGPASEYTNSPPAASHNDLRMQSAQHIEPVVAREGSDAKAVDLSDFNPTSLDVHESVEPKPTSQSDIGLLDEPSRTPQYNLATTWAQEHLQLTIPSPTSTTPSRLRATVTHLRAYHLWHHQKLPVDRMAEILRDPPLARNTVANYILQAVTLERLEYEQECLKNILLAMPAGMRKGRWRTLAEEVGASK